MATVKAPGCGPPRSLVVTATQVPVSPPVPPAVLPADGVVAWALGAALGGAMSEACEAGLATGLPACAVGLADPAGVPGPADGCFAPHADIASSRSAAEIAVFFMHLFLALAGFSLRG